MLSFNIYSCGIVDLQEPDARFCNGEVEANASIPSTTKQLVNFIITSIVIYNFKDEIQLKTIRLKEMSQIRKILLYKFNTKYERINAEFKVLPFGI